MIDTELLEEYKNSLSDRYTAIELCELLVDRFDLDIWAVMEAFGDEMLMELFQR